MAITQQRHSIIRNSGQQSSAYGLVGFFAAIGLGVLLVVIAPATEWLLLIPYLIVIGLLGVWIYQRGIRDVGLSFPAALFVVVLLVRLASATARYWMVTDLYNNASDAPGYYREGLYLAQYLRVLDFSILDSYQWRRLGTTHTVHLAAVVYTFLPPTMIGGFLFFSGIAFLGSVLFYKSVRNTWPGQSHHIYLFMVFLMPSILFWPSSLGKDSWLLFCSGVVMLGWVKYTIKEQSKGLLWVIIGLSGAYYVRPHIAFFLAMALATAYFLYATKKKNSATTLSVGMLVFIVLGYFLFQGGLDYIQISEFSVDELQGFVEYQQRQTYQGGSRFDSINILTVPGILNAFATVLLRPYLWEASSTVMVLASLEIIVWIGIYWYRRRVFWWNLTNFRSNPVVAFALIYSVVMIIALSSLSNFGILVRQRVMMLPFFWIMFVGPEPEAQDRRTRRIRRAERFFTR